MLSVNVLILLSPQIIPLA